MSENTNSKKNIVNNNSFILGLFVNYLKPSLFVDSIENINIKELKNQGIKWLFCDLDNTLVPHFTKNPTKSVIKFVNEVKKNQINFILTSNNTKKRVEFFAQKLNVDDYLFNLKKPFSRKINKFLKENNVVKEEAIIIGDMIIVDILVANILNIESILVYPLFSNEKQSNKFTTFLENRVFKRLSRDNLIITEDVKKKSKFLIEYEIL